MPDSADNLPAVPVAGQKTIGYQMVTGAAACGRKEITAILKV